MPTPMITRETIEDRCVNYIATSLDVPKAEVDPGISFESLGLDSATAVAMVMELEEFLGIELEPELLFEHTTVRDLAAHLVAVVATTNGAQVEAGR